MHIFAVLITDEHQHVLFSLFRINESTTSFFRCTVGIFCGLCNWLTWNSCSVKKFQFSYSSNALIAIVPLRQCLLRHKKRFSMPAGEPISSSHSNDSCNINWIFFFVRLLYRFYSKQWWQFRSYHMFDVWKLWYFHQTLWIFHNEHAMAHNIG